jgi:hypothetical protein
MSQMTRKEGDGMLGRREMTRKKRDGMLRPEGGGWDARKERDDSERERWDAPPAPPAGSRPVARRSNRARLSDGARAPPLKLGCGALAAKDAALKSCAAPAPRANASRPGHYII